MDDKHLKKLRAIRFREEARKGIPEAPKKIRAHPEGSKIVVQGGDLDEMLIRLCKRNLAVGEELSEHQLKELRRLNIDPDSLLSESTASSTVQTKAPIYRETEKRASGITAPRRSLKQDTNGNIYLGPKKLKVKSATGRKLTTKTRTLSRKK